MTRTALRLAAALIGLLLALTLDAPALPVAPASGGGDTWHPVQEARKKYVEETLTLPAADYCGAFRLRLKPQRQGIFSRVTSRWDNGKIRTQVFTGPLISRAVNLTSGAHVDVDLGGEARIYNRPDGSLASYEMDGPVGMGWPEPSDLARGYYRLSGHHLVTFDPDGSRHLVVDSGKETDICLLVD